MNIETCDDVEELRQFFKQYLEDVDTKQLGLTANIDVILENLKSSMQSENEIVFVAKKDGNIIGIASLLATQCEYGDETIVYARYWYCLKEHPWAGLKLYRAIMEWAKLKGCSHFIAMESRLIKASRRGSIARLLIASGAREYETSYIMDVA